MINGSLQRAMEAEHCEMRDHAKTFASSNGVSTSSEVEWEFVVKAEEGKAYPERPYFVTSWEAANKSAEEAAAAAEAADAPPEAATVATETAAARDAADYRRKTVPFLEFEQSVAMVNTKLREMKHVPLIIEEAIAGRLCA